MGDINYAPVIQDMTWSYSRIKTFDDCPYRFYLRYIRCLPRNEQFFANYGSFMHKLIEKYYSEGKSRSQLCDTYMREFKSQIHGNAPNPTVFGNYFKSGLQYVRTLSPLPYKPLAIEKRVDLRINDIPFTGCIDFLGESNGNLYIVDHKSRNLKRRSTRPKPTQSDEELDEYLRQLYLYAAAVKQEYGKYPIALCFNCFREQMLIVEPFRLSAYHFAQKWLVDKVAEITNETDFDPDVDFFKCNHLCEMKEHCVYCELCKRGRR